MFPFRLSTIIARTVGRRKELEQNPIKNEGAEHLCVFIHGFYGSSSDMEYAAQALRKEFSGGKLHILNIKGNSGTLTWDGCEQGGERVCQEIVEEIDLLQRSGERIKKLSIIGYSLGGLFGRYAIGLLYSKGYLDKIEPVNFVTVATPHLGVRTPLKGILNRLWNSVGARALSLSGRQLFMIDNFRGTGRPLLEVVADPESVFMHALRLFRRRTLYANIVNEDSTTWYTTGISKTDPFENISDLSYVEGYEPVLVDLTKPMISGSPYKHQTPSVGTLIFATAKKTLIAVFLTPVLFLFFILGSSYLSFQSTRRITRHKTGKTEIKVSDYQIPFLISKVQQEVRQLYGESLGSLQPNKKHVSSSIEFTSAQSEALDGTAIPDTKNTQLVSDKKELKEPQDLISIPALALTPAQFKIINALDDLGWRKYPVHIHNTRHSHSAIIFRIQEPEYEEGKVVIKHWLREEFVP